MKFVTETGYSHDPFAHFWLCFSVVRFVNFYSKYCRKKGHGSLGVPTRIRAEFKNGNTVPPACYAPKTPPKKTKGVFLMFWSKKKLKGFCLCFGQQKLRDFYMFWSKKIKGILFMFWSTKILAFSI